MRTAIVATAAALLLSGCSGDSPTPAPTAEGDTTGGRPQLVVTSLCYGECAFTAPLGLPEVAVYADGRLVSVDRRGADSRPVLRLAQLTRDELAALQSLALKASLGSGDSGTIALSGGAPSDGGGTVVTARLRGSETTVEVPLLDLDEPEPDRYTDGDRVTAIAELLAALREAAAAAEKGFTPTGYVVRATPTQTTTPDAAAWPGPALTGLPQVEPGVRCVIVTGAPQAAVASAVDGDGFPGTYTSGGRAWTVVGRALLPHEQSCRDVLETAAVTVRTEPRFPGDARK